MSLQLPREMLALIINYLDDKVYNFRERRYEDIREIEQRNTFAMLYNNQYLPYTPEASKFMLSLTNKQFYEIIGPKILNRINIHRSLSEFCAHHGYRSILKEFCYGAPYKLSCQTMIHACLSNNNNLIEELLENSCPIDNRALFWSSFINPAVISFLREKEFPDKYTIDINDSKYLTVEEINSSFYHKPGPEIFIDKSFKGSNILSKYNLDYLIHLFQANPSNINPVSFDIIVERAIAESKIAFLKWVYREYNYKFRLTKFKISNEEDMIDTYLFLLSFDYININELQRQVPYKKLFKLNYYRYLKLVIDRPTDYLYKGCYSIENIEWLENNYYLTPTDPYIFKRLGYYPLKPLLKYSKAHKNDFLYKFNLIYRFIKFLGSQVELNNFYNLYPNLDKLAKCDQWDVADGAYKGIYHGFGHNLYEIISNLKLIKHPTFYSASNIIPFLPRKNWSLIFDYVKSLNCEFSDNILIIAAAYNRLDVFKWYENQYVYRIPVYKYAYLIASMRNCTKITDYLYNLMTPPPSPGPLYFDDFNYNFLKIPIDEIFRLSHPRLVKYLMKLHPLFQKYIFIKESLITVSYKNIFYQFYF